jgi:hypothetical protein
MTFDPPQPGQVIGYRYLWWSEHRKGLEEGAKVTTRLREMIRARVREKNISTVDRDFDAEKALEESRRRKLAKDRNKKR